MGFRNGAFATVFSVKKGTGNFYDVNITTSKKDKKTDSYVTDFRGFVRFIGDAATKIAKYNGRESKNEGNHPITKIKLGSVETTNSYNAEKKQTYVNHAVYSFDFTDEATGGNANTKSANDYANAVPTGDDEALFT